MQNARKVFVPDPGRSAPAAAAITEAEWRWVGWVGGALLGLTCLPLAVAAANAPAGTDFGGFVYVARDGYVYLAALREGMRGAWLFTPPYTSETLPGVLLYPLYLLAGHLVAGLHASPVLAFHALRLAFGGWLLAAIYGLAARLFWAVGPRRVAFLLASLGGGIGPLIGTHLHLGLLPLRPLEMLVWGSTVVDSLNLAPHVPLAEALFVSALLLAAPARMSGAWRWSLLAVVMLALITIYPALVVLAVLILASLHGLRRDSRRALMVITTAAPTVPYAAYILVLQRQDPSPLAVIGLHFDVGDPIGFFLLAHTIPVVLLGVACWQWRGRLPEAAYLPVVWIAWCWILLFGPWSAVLGRAFYAVSVPFALLAPWGLGAVRALLGRRQQLARRLQRLAIVMTCFFAFFTVAQGFWIAAYRLDGQATYVPGDAGSALVYLREHASPRDVVLGSYFSGLFIPAYAGCRTYVGHPDQTLDVRRKDAASRAFYLAPDGNFLAREGIRFVIWGPNEQAYGGPAPDLEGLRLAFQAGQVRVYEWVPAGEGESFSPLRRPVGIAELPLGGNQAGLHPLSSPRLGRGLL